MEDDRSEISSFVGTASEQAGRVVGHIAALGRRITGFGVGMASAGKDVLGLAEDDIKHVPKKASDNTKAVASSSDVRVAQKKLAEVQKQSQEKESQLQAMQKKNNALISELEQAVSQAKETSACEGAARARVAALELELEIKFSTANRSGAFTETVLNPSLIFSITIPISDGSLYFRSS